MTQIKINKPIKKES